MCVHTDHIYEQEPLKIARSLSLSISERRAWSNDETEAGRWRGCPWCPRLSNAGLCSVLAQEAGSAAAALLLLGLGRPEHAACQGGCQPWGKGHSHQAPPPPGAITWQWGGPRALYFCQVLSGTTAPTRWVHRAGGGGSLPSHFQKDRGKRLGMQGGTVPSPLL